MYKDNTLKTSKGQALKSTDINRANAFGVEPLDLSNDLQLFDLMNPFITCPPPGVLTKVRIAKGPGS